MAAKRGSARLITCRSTSCIVTLLALPCFKTDYDRFCFAPGPTLPVQPRREQVEDGRSDQPTSLPGCFLPDSPLRYDSIRSCQTTVYLLFSRLGSVCRHAQTQPSPQTSTDIPTTARLPLTHVKSHNGRQPLHSQHSYAAMGGASH